MNPAFLETKRITSHKFWGLRRGAGQAQEGKLVVRALPGGSAPARRSPQAAHRLGSPAGRRGRPGPQVSSGDCGPWSPTGWCGGLREASGAAGSAGHSSPDPWGPVSLRKSLCGHTTAQADCAAWTPGGPAPCGFAPAVSQALLGGVCMGCRMGLWRPGGTPVSPARLPRGSVTGVPAEDTSLQAEAPCPVWGKVENRTGGCPLGHVKRSVER